MYVRVDVLSNFLENMILGFLVKHIEKGDLTFDEEIMDEKSFFLFVQ